MAGYATTFTVRYQAEDAEIVRIPDEFQDILYEGFQGVNLKVHGKSRAWEATMVQQEDGNNWITVLEGGWCDFVRDNSVIPGDGLKFTYTGQSTFYVQILRPTVSRRTENSSPDKGNNSLSKRRGRKPAYHGSSASMAETNGRLEELADHCREPHFRFIFTAPYLKKGAINVPVEFDNRWLSELEDSSCVLLQSFDTQFVAKVKCVKNGGLITKCEIQRVTNFTSQYNVQENQGALIKYRKGYPALFDVDLVPI